MIIGQFVHDLQPKQILRQTDRQTLNCRMAKFLTVVPLLKVLPFDSLKFVCLSVLIFVWAVYNVKMYQLSQKLDMIFKEETLVCIQN